MLLFKKSKLSEQEGKVDNSILNWGMSNDNFLNVLSPPYNSSKIFLKVILYYAKMGKSTVYITNENQYEINLLDIIKKYTTFRDYTYVKNLNISVNSSLKICNFSSAVNIKEKFDLVIYDDINSFPTHNKYEILDLVSKMSKENSKVIVYSIESILNCKREIVLPAKDNMIPMVEPRIILTRLDINKDIPFVIYDYLRWSINSDRKVIICVPDEEKVESVYFYIRNYCRSINKGINCFCKDRLDKKLLSKFEKLKKAVIITDNFEQVFSNADNIDVMVYFADDFKFDYKKLIYFCGSVNRGEKNSKGEVIFLANEETNDMEKARDITRNFNKEAWEMGLLRI